MSAGARSYQQFCALARALDLLGERWTLLVVRELLLGPKRYRDLLDGLPGIASNLLARRLRRLTDAGLVRRVTLPPPASTPAYELTDRGRGLEPIVLDLARWQMAEMPPPKADDELRGEGYAVALRAAFRPERARKRETYQFDVGGFVFHFEVERGSVHAALGSVRRPDLTISAESRPFLRLLSGAVTADEAIADGSVAVEGPKDALERCLSIFALPPLAATER